MGQFSKHQVLLSDSMRLTAARLAAIVSISVLIPASLNRWVGWGKQLDNWYRNASQMPQWLAPLA